MSEGNGHRFSIESIGQLRDRAMADLKALSDSDAAERFRVAYLGKKGELRELLKVVREVPENLRKEFGEQANNLRVFLESEFEKGPWSNRASASTGPAPIDSSLPGYP